MQATPFIGLAVFFFFLIHRQATLLATSFSDYVLKFYGLLFGHVLFAGWIVSWLRGVNEPLVWGAVTVSEAAVVFLLLQKLYPGHKSWRVNEAWNEGKAVLWDALMASSGWVRASAFILFVGVLLTACINSAILLLTVPNEWDSMTGHLVKAAYYLQLGRMERVGGTIWSIDYYPNSITSIQLYFYHLFGEKGFRFPHFLAFWAYVMVIYGITRTFFQKPVWSLMSAFLAALLPTALVQGTTTETDLILTVYVGLVVYCLAHFHRTRRGRWLYWAAWMGTMALGHKITFLMIAPSIVLLLGYIFWIKFPRWKHIVGGVGAFVIGLAIFVLPMGYIGNIKAAKKFSIGALTAPPEVLAYHGTQHFTARQKWENFHLNVGRYGTEFISLDGIRLTKAGKPWQDVLKAPIRKIAQKWGLERDQYWVVKNFQIEQHPIKFYIERPYWGVIGFLIVFPLLALALFTRKLGATSSLIRVLTFCALIQFILLCFTAPYDPLKGRYFLSMSVWILPVGGFLWENVTSSWRKIYGLVLAVLIVWAGLGVVLHRQLAPTFADHVDKPFWKMTRLEQLTLSRPDLYPAFRRFDALVPANAIVALGTDTEDFEYPLWGPGLKRTLIPLHPFHQGMKSIPLTAQYLVYTEGMFPYQDGDIQLNYRKEDRQWPDILIPKKYFLRKLKP